jgi:endonuclease III
LLSLPGIGPKAADCIMEIGLGFSSIVVDINVFRMSTYIFGLKLTKEHSFSNPESVKMIKERLDAAIGDDAFLCQIVHTMLLLAGRRLGKIHESKNCAGKEYCLSCKMENMGQLSFYN